mmetsp:Transcript_68588/g.221598  ORF Transcript_68588/g.221598 Transcript_68588/m.221598 type:complete len:209 (-) Transcript_68588:1451-2077(-)
MPRHADPHRRPQGRSRLQDLPWPVGAAVAPWQAWVEGRQACRPTAWRWWNPGRRGCCCRHGHRRVALKQLHQPSLARASALRLTAASRCGAWAAAGPSGLRAATPSWARAPPTPWPCCPAPSHGPGPSLGPSPCPSPSSSPCPSPCLSPSSCYPTRPSCCGPSPSRRVHRTRAPCPAWAAAPPASRWRPVASPPTTQPLNLGRRSRRY